jgi:hypothetical protein
MYHSRKAGEGILRKQDRKNSLKINLNKEVKLTRKSLKVLMAILLVIGLTSILSAQGALTGALTGKVVDNEGNALPGVTVTVEGPALLGKVAYVTTEAGTFRFPALPPGSGYQLTLELPGFNTIVRKGLIVSVGKATAVTVTMAMATLEEEITVVGESPTVDVKSSKTSHPKHRLTSPRVLSIISPWPETSMMFSTPFPVLSQKT